MRYLIFFSIVIAFFLPLNSHAQQSGQIITSENTDQLQLIQTLGRGKALDAKWSPDGEWFGVLTSRGVWLYDSNDLTVEPIQVGDDLVPMTAFTFHPYKNQLVTAQRGNIVFWDTESHSPVREIEGFAGDIVQMVISPDGLRLATVGQTVPIIGFERDYYPDERVRIVLRDLLTGQPISTITDEYRNMGGMEFTPDGQYFMTNIYDVSDGFFGSHLNGWRSDNGQFHHSVLAFMRSVDVDISPDGKLLLSGGRTFVSTSTIMTLSGETVASVQVPYEETDYLLIAAFAAGSDHVVYGSGHNLFLYSIATDEMSHMDITPGEIQLIASHPQQNQRLIVVDKDGVISHYQHWQPVGRLEHYQNPIQELAVTMDGSLVMNRQRLASPITDGVWSNMEVWDTITTQEAFFTESEIITSIAISHNNRMMAFTDARGVLNIVDIASGRPIESVEILPGCLINDIDFSHDDSTVLVLWQEGGYRENGRYLFCENGVEDTIFEFELFPSPDEDATLEPLKFYPQRNYEEDPLLEAVFNADTTIAVIAAPAEVQIWKRTRSLGALNTQFVHNRTNGREEILSLDLSSGGNWVVYGGLIYLIDGPYGPPLFIGTGLYRMDIATLSVEQFGEAQIHAVAISPDDHLIAASEDNVTVIRDADSMEILHTMETGRANAIQFTADGTKLVVGGEDGVVRVWGVE